MEDDVTDPLLEFINLLEGDYMCFEEFWQKLFGTSIVAIIKNREGRAVPVRLGDRDIAEFFWRKGFDSAVGKLKE